MSGTASWNGVDANDVPFENSRSYTDILPSFNFVLNATDTQKLRFGAARVMSPQNLQQLGAGLQYGFTRAAPGECTGRCGRVLQIRRRQCRQLRARSVPRLAVRPLMGRLLLSKRLWSASDISTRPWTISSPPRTCRPWLPTAPAQRRPMSPRRSMAAPARSMAWNSAASTRSTSAWALPANYTRADSSSTQTSSFGAELPIPGVSKNSVNATVYFERAGFSARAAYAWRDTAVNSGGVGSSFAFAGHQRRVEGIHGVPGRVRTAGRTGELRFQSSTSASWCQVVNLTDAKQHTYLQLPNEPFTYDDTGRRLYFGVKGKL